jgi:iduronate 2-sulfatase
MSRTHFLLLILLMAGAGLNAQSAPERPNILLILIDDLKPTLGCYGDPHAITPEMDRLAARGMRFDLAYCNQAVCAPSRFTLMLGSHSTSTGLYGLGSQLRELLPDAVTLPQHFANHGGYRTESLGKVFHIGHGNEGDPASFTQPHLKDIVIEYLDPASTQGGQLTREEALFTNQKLDAIRSLPRGAAFESPPAEDDDYADGRVATATIQRLTEAKQRRAQEGTPFFIACGFVRPHLPFSAPKKYWDLYDPYSLPLASNPDLPINSPLVAQKRGGEIAAYSPIPEDPQAPIDPALQRQLIHGYYASTSYVDAQVGRVLRALDELQLSRDTIVVLWSDHGFHLGDLGIWTKHTNYEQANRIPLIIAAPGVTPPGTVTKQLTSSVDLYPTLAELAGLPPPTGPQSIDGISLLPVLQDPEARVRDHAYHAFPRGKIGVAIRTERHRLVQWKNPGDPETTAEWEFYDYQTDPLESQNLAPTAPPEMEALKTILKSYPEPLPFPQGSRNKPKAAAKAKAKGGKQ